MDIYPRVEIDLDKIRHNVKVLKELCTKTGIDIAAVTKVFCAIPEIAEVMVENGATMLADSRVENLEKLKDIEIPKLLLRLPMMSQSKKVVTYADISLNSELRTMECLNEAAKELNKMHNIILMIDLGDLREGVWKDQIMHTVEKILQLKHLNLIGIGTNLTCYGGVIPSKENLGYLVEVADRIQREFNINLSIISGGNSSSLYLIEKGEMPDSINHLRLGESIILGRETAYGKAIENTCQDAFTLLAEVIELKEKPSVPIGEIGMDAFGNKPVFEDKGIRKRAILAIGRQDISPQNLIPRDQHISILGASSDHLIIDVTESTRRYEVGDVVTFDVEYGALLQLMTSEYVYKKIINK